MQTNRRNILKHGPVALVGMAVASPVAANEPPLDPEALEVARLFQLVEDDSTRASLHQCARWCAGLQSDPALSARIPPASAYYTRDIAVLDRGEAS